MWCDRPDLAKARMEAWWRREGCALCVTAPKDAPWADVVLPPVPSDPEAMWTDLDYRLAAAVATLARTYYGGAAFPYLDTQIGPGSLGLFLGCEPGFAPDTVWYKPALLEPTDAPIRFDPENRWFRLHEEFMRRAAAMADGRFLVGLPDLIENLDTLAQLRDPETLMEDLAERPEWVEARIWEINDAFFEAFDRLAVHAASDWGGNAFAFFRVWGPGKTAKLQCDAMGMISPAMFQRFVVPALTAQCDWLDFSMFHLDGTQNARHLDDLLAIGPLTAVEWTPQAGIEGGGSPRWYDLYRRILAAGKAVQAIGVQPDEVLPLLDAVGHEGMFVMVEASSEAEARDLERRVYGSL